MSSDNPDSIAMNVFWAVIVCAGGFSLATYLVVF